MSWSRLLLAGALSLLLAPAGAFQIGAAIGGGTSIPPLNPSSLPLVNHMDRGALHVLICPPLKWDIHLQAATSVPTTHPGRGGCSSMHPRTAWCTAASQILMGVFCPTRCHACAAPGSKGQGVHRRDDGQKGRWVCRKAPGAPQGRHRGRGQGGHCRSGGYPFPQHLSSPPRTSSPHWPPLATRRGGLVCDAHGRGIPIMPLSTLPECFPHMCTTSEECYVRATSFMPHSLWTSRLRTPAPPPHNQMNEKRRICRRP